MSGRRLGHDARVFLFSLLAGLPGAVTGLILLWKGDFDSKMQWTVTLAILLCWIGLSFAVRAQVVRPLQTISNLLGALREGDFSIRGRLSTGRDALGGALQEVNSLGETLREQRLGAVEATALLRKVMDEIDVAIFAFDSDQCLRLANRTGERLLGHPVERLLGRNAKELAISALLEGEAPRTVVSSFPGGSGQWELRRGSFRQGGLPHQLVVLTDLGRALREEERHAWQRLVRVLGHEINNSLAPIRSIASNLMDHSRRTPHSAEWEEDLHRGLEVITRRSEALSRFMTSYARLARLPPPRHQPVDVGSWIRRVAELEKRVKVEVVPGPDVVIRADGDQLDQLLINLVQNAVDAVTETGGAVSVHWKKLPASVEVLVTDDGPGVSNTGNLFVPFFTTKLNGSGIGLVLSRQIAEAHRGSLSLQNREDGRGCVAKLSIPIQATERGSPVAFRP